jgi:hypothetical protein
MTKDEAERTLKEVDFSEFEDNPFDQPDKVERSLRDFDKSLDRFLLFVTALGVIATLLLVWLVDSAGWKL